MAGPLRRRRLESLLILATRLSSESSGGLLGDALDLLLDATEAQAGAAFSVTDGVDQVAERGVAATEASAGALRDALSVVAARAAQARRPIWVSDLGRESSSAPELAAATAQGLNALLAVPIVHRRTPLGALLLLFSVYQDLDDEGAAFAETVAHIVALAVDREQRVEMEQAQRTELEEAGRMASLGLLTATVAHELRGPVGALVLQLEEQHRLLEQLSRLGGSSDTAIGGAVAELDELTRDVDAAVARIRSTVEQLSTLSRHDSEPENIDLSTIVRESLSVARPHLERRGITLIEELDPGCFTVGRRDNLGQVVLNLVFNAADACEHSTAPNPQIVVRSAEETKHVVLAVEDTGPGVPRHQIPTIFTPFFTTKKRGHGTGLGLKICSDVVSQHGGHIEVQNRPSGGASFRVLLPRSDDDSGVYPKGTLPEERSPQPQSVPPRRVLVVDDDPLFSRSLRRALRPHDVRAAATASEAEIALLDSDYEPDLVLCDVFLPGTNGDALHARIAARRPEIAPRFVFVTGGGLDKEAADYIRRSGCRTLFKPLQLKELRENLEAEGGDRPTPHVVRTLSNLPARASAHPPRPSRPPGRED